MTTIDIFILLVIILGIIFLCVAISIFLKRKNCEVPKGKMRNFPVNVDGKEYWISRSNAVVGIIYKYDENDDICIAASKRGTGCPDYVGYWNIPCGYLDYDENIAEAVSREIFEEIGLDVPEEDWFLWYVNSDPSDEKQTVSFRFVLPYDKSYGRFTNENCEPKEVEAIRWIKLKDVDDYEWAFNQREVLTEFHKSMTSDMLDFKIKNGINIKVNFK